jgi:hypothetical protein
MNIGIILLFVSDFLACFVISSSIGKMLSVCHSVHPSMEEKTATDTKHISLIAHTPRCKVAMEES